MADKSRSETSGKLQVFEYEGHKITFEFEDGQKMVNATQMAKPFKKKSVNGFLRTEQTKKFIEKLNSRYADIRHGSNHKALRKVQGGTPQMQGTWMDEILALKFAAYLSPDFEIWVYETIKSILTEERKMYEFFLQKLEDHSRDSLFIAKMLKEKFKKE